MNVELWDGDGPFDFIVSHSQNPRDFGFGLQLDNLNKRSNCRINIKLSHNFTYESCVHYKLPHQDSNHCSENHKIHKPNIS